MKKVALLLLAVVMVGWAGCGGSGSKEADVQQGSTPSLIWYTDGTLHVWGDVVNLGDGDAENVELTFFFGYNSDLSIDPFHIETIDIGMVRAGERVSFDRYLQGPSIPHGSTVYFNYSISWE